MSDTRSINVAKCVTLLSFLVLVSVTYFLRREVLALSHIHFSSDEARALHELEEMKSSYPERDGEYNEAMVHYQEEAKHYQKMLELYRTDEEEYMKLVKGKYDLPALPSPPDKPQSPRLSATLHELNTQFRSRKNEYFANALSLNWVAWIAALGLVGGLVYLLMFDTAPTRWHYLAALVMSFVFMIGPAFHSIITTIIGILEAPSTY